ncbi:PaaI family thioesterase [Nocardioides sp. NPDC101246]|uniref:PaaI family thioesterase n=1 Tax=Nocardioides sp. NPDC101246 TaxID=3364336 RepID=UPI0037FCFED9
MDTQTRMAAIPAHEDPDVAWRDWVNSYPTFLASGLRCVEMGERKARFGLDETLFPLNPNGAVNGGVVALAVDQAMGALSARVTPTGATPVTANLQVQYHAPAFPEITMDAVAIGGGNVIQAIEVIVRNAKGQRCCTAMGTMAVGPVRRTAGEAKV